jgi:hypothetical protein
MGHKGQRRDLDILLEHQQNSQRRIEPAGKEGYAVTAFLAVLVVHKFAFYTLSESQAQMQHRTKYITKVVPEFFDFIIEYSYFAACAKPK